MQLQCIFGHVPVFCIARFLYYMYYRGAPACFTANSSCAPLFCCPESRMPVTRELEESAALLNKINVRYRVLEVSVRKGIAINADWDPRVLPGVPIS
jgi:hypothetical protein